MHRKEQALTVNETLLLGLFMTLLTITIPLLETENAWVGVHFLYKQHTQQAQHVNTVDSVLQLKLRLHLFMILCLTQQQKIRGKNGLLGNAHCLFASMQDCQALKLISPLIAKPLKLISPSIQGQNFVLENMYFSNSYTSNTRAQSARDIRFPMLCCAGTCTGGAPAKLWWDTTKCEKYWHGMRIIKL